MLQHNFHKSLATTQILHKPLLASASIKAAPAPSFAVSQRKIIPTKKVLKKQQPSTSVKALLTSHEKSSKTSVKAVITVLKDTVWGALTHLDLSPGFDVIMDCIGRSLLIELVAAELDPQTGEVKKNILTYARRSNSHQNEIYYVSGKFEIPEDFGPIGAVLIENGHLNEMFVQNIVFHGFSGGSVDVTCNSWIHPECQNKEKRVFFCNKSYLPHQTPDALKGYRQKELEILRGNGQGQRKTADRVYDYDVYNDLGDPDADDELKRPVLGGTDHPYPRRCRTGRPRTKKDPLSETRSNFVYVPRDEAFSEVKLVTFITKSIYSELHALGPTLESYMGIDLDFPYFTAIDTLFNEGVELPTTSSTAGLLGCATRLVKGLKAIIDAENNILRFETPQLMDRDKFAWFRDSEFARQTLAGLNPCCIKLITEWPMKSKLDPKTYGPAESALTTELVEEELRGLMTVDEAVKQKKLFVLDYHDVYLPYVIKVRELKGTSRTLFYGSRTLFFLKPDKTLRPLAIELTRPPIDSNDTQWKEVYKQGWDATSVWLWRLAKAHVLAHDSGFHQLVSHWLRTHCSTEPYIIALNRQLSAMHPIYRLLHPHFRYTMEINAKAREKLINANGIIEKNFSPHMCSMELSSVAYDKLWRFDQEALPADLINRGMAVEDPKAHHGLKLTIEDYPYANDGLLIWDAIKKWVADYVNHFYQDDNFIQSDDELQAWWTEIRTVGHGDKKDKPWWPDLKTRVDLIGILTTIIWVASGHHAAVNFGQYDFGGYFPNRPTIARTPMPYENPNEEVEKQLFERPEELLLKCFPSQIQATTVMATLDILSNHSPDEEYIGEKIQPYWADDKIINAAFKQFNRRIKEIEGIIDKKNADTNLKNRTGAGLVPYELLKPYSEPGVTSKGVPNSISI